VLSFHISEIPCNIISHQPNYTDKFTRYACHPSPKRGARNGDSLRINNPESTYSLVDLYHNTAEFKSIVSAVELDENVLDYEKSGFTKPSISHKVFPSWNWMPRSSYIENNDISKIRVEIHILAWKRSKSLSRLLKSLIEAENDKSTIFDILFHLDGEATSDVINVIDKFKWTSGEVTVTKEGKRIGLKSVNNQFPSSLFYN